MFVCGHSNVRTLTSPPILKLWDTQGYLWLPYDLTKVINLIGETIGSKKFFFAKKYFMSFLPQDFIRRTLVHNSAMHIIYMELLALFLKHCKKKFWKSLSAR